MHIICLKQFNATQAELTIIGDGTEKENIKEQIYNLNLAKNVKLISNITDEERDQIYLTSNWNIYLALEVLAHCYRSSYYGMSFISYKGMFY